MSRYKLNRHSTEYLGTSNDILKHANLSRKKLGELPSCQTADYIFHNCYSRYVPLSGDTIIKVDEPKIIVRKLCIGNGFFPTVAAHEISIDYKGNINSWKHKLDKYFEPYFKEFISYEWKDNTLLIKNLHTTTAILEYDFLPHNFGPIISLLTTIN